MATDQAFGMKLCPKCSNRYPGDANFCPKDAGRLIDIPDDASESSVALAAAGARVVGDRFELGDELGGGLTGDVCLATDLETGAACTVKRVDTAVFPSPLLLQRSERELKQLRRIDHPGIARVLAHGRVDDTLWIAAELVEDAVSLHELVHDEGPLPAERACALALKAGQALAEAAKVGVIHRDLAPKNILVAPGDAVKLINFGVAVPTDAKIPGVPEFVAPELIEGKPVDQRSNIYSLGAVLYFALTGNPPFTGDPEQVHAQHLEGEVLAPSELVELPDALADAIDALVLKALARASSKRFMTVRQLLAELERVVTGGDAGATQPMGRAGSEAGRRGKSRRKTTERPTKLDGYGALRRATTGAEAAARGAAEMSAEAGSAAAAGAHADAHPAHADATDSHGDATAPAGDADDPGSTQVGIPPAGSGPVAATPPPDASHDTEVSRPLVAGHDTAVSRQLGAGHDTVISPPPATGHDTAISPPPATGHDTVISPPPAVTGDAPGPAAPAGVPAEGDARPPLAATVVSMPALAADADEPARGGGAAGAGPAARKARPDAATRNISGGKPRLVLDGDQPRADSDGDAASADARDDAPGPARARRKPAPEDGDHDPDGKHKGKFRETMWFKKGELDEQAALEAERDKRRAGGEIRDRSDSIPIEDRYADDGTLTDGDEQKFSLKTGDTHMMPSFRDRQRARASTPVSERELIGELKIGRGKILAAIGVGLLLLIVVIVYAVSGGSGPADPERRDSAPGLAPDEPAAADTPEQPAAR